MRQSLETCKGETYQVYYALRENLYADNWRDAPIVKRLGLAIYTVALGGATHIMLTALQWGLVL